MGHSGHLSENAQCDLLLPHAPRHQIRQSQYFTKNIHKNLAAFGFVDYGSHRDQVVDKSFILQIGNCFSEVDFHAIQNVIDNG